MSKIGIGVSRIPMFFFFFILIILNFSRRQVVCQSWQEYRQTGNPNLIPFMTSLVYSGLSNVTNIFLGEVSNKLDFCVKDVNAEWNVAFNYSSDLGFLESCIERTRGDIVHRLCTAAEIKFYFRSFLERGSKSINSLEPNRNCNLTTWNPGCEPGWACGIGLDQKIDLKNSKDIPSRTRDCQSCCAGFFCPRGLTCMIPCPLGAYCPLAELNETTGICDPYSYPLPPGHQNHTCGGADTWADIRSSSNVFCSAGSYCPSTVKKFPCSSGHYCRTGSTSQKRCFKLTSCNSNTATQHLHVYGAFLIAALSTLLLIIYSCSDQVLSIRERRQAKSRETAARSAKESAHARERWKAARAIAKKGVLGLQRQMSRTFSLKSSGTQPEEMIMLDQASAGPDDPIFSTDISVASEEPSAAAKTNNKEPSNHTKAVHSLDEHSVSYDSSSSFESGDKHIKRQKPKVRHLHTNTQIFEYAYGKLEKEKALEQQNKNMSFSGVINMATRRVTSTRPVIEVAFKDLTLTLKGKHKHLLRCVTGKIRPGRVSAVMGPSGAGKTTFLNALAGKATGCTMTGLILINGRNESIHSYKKIIGFVPQDDIVHGNLTVEENLQFSAKCRLSADMPKADKVLVVERVIESLGLQAVRDSLVGTVEQRGISGGQRKRVNVGLEMVMEPSLLILDEPTSGLDSSSSHLLLRALRREALEGVNICMVVHQPSYTLFKMFDDLILLAKGGLTVYHGPVRKVEEYFASLGIIVPDRVNPPDHFIDILEGIVKPTTNIDMTQLPVRFMLYNGYPVPPDMQHCGADIASTSNYRDTSDVADRASAEDDDNQSFAGDLWQDVKCNVELRREHILLNFLKLKDLSNRKTPGAYRQYRYYLGRVSKQRLREAKVQAMDLLILLLAGASLGIIAKVSDETFGAAGYTYTVIAVSLLCKIAALRSFSLDKLIYWRESASGMSSLAYFLSKDTIDLFSILVKPVVYLSMFYFFNSPRSSFIDNYTVLVCLVYCVTGIGYAFSIFLHPGPAQLASVLLPVVFTLIATQPRTGYMKVIPNFCYPKWALEAFVISNAKRYSGVWLITRCGSLMKTGYDVRAWNRCLGILLIYGAVSRVLAYICMVSTKKK